MFYVQINRTPKKNIHVTTSVYEKLKKHFSRRNIESMYKLGCFRNKMFFKCFYNEDNLTGFIGLISRKFVLRLMCFTFCQMWLACQLQSFVNLFVCLFVLIYYNFPIVCLFLYIFPTFSLWCSCFYVYFLHFPNVCWSLCVLIYYIPVVSLSMCINFLQFP